MHSVHQVRIHRSVARMNSDVHIAFNTLSAEERFSHHFVETRIFYACIGDDGVLLSREGRITRLCIGAIPLILVQGQTLQLDRITCAAHIGFRACNGEAGEVSNRNFLWEAVVTSINHSDRISVTSYAMYKVSYTIG